MAAWDECRHALRRAFGITPTAATNELGRHILATEADAVQTAPATTPDAAQAAAQPAGRAALPTSLPAALRSPRQLVGRAGELARITEALAQGHAAVVAGPGGVGKSRLLAAAAYAMQPAVMVGGRPGDHLLPGALASRLVAAAIERFDPELDTTTRADIRRLLPGGPEAASAANALRSALEHRRVLDAVARTMLACHAKGMRLVVVDDLQFGDEVSLAAIEVVMAGWIARPPTASSVAMFGLRPDELRPAAASLVRRLDGSGRSARVDLGPLDATALRALLAGLPWQELGGAAGQPQAPEYGALASALLARVGGTPAYVLEALRLMWPQALRGWREGSPLPVPASLVDSVRQRLARLEEQDAEALQLAQLASVAESDFSLALAASAFGRTPLALAPLFARLEAAQVLDGTGFTHDLVADAVARSVPESMRGPLHRLVAEHLMGQQAPPARIAAHLDATGDARGAAHWHLQAAERAMARWQLNDATTSYAAALRGVDEAGERPRVVHALLRSTRAWLWLSRPAEAQPLLERAAALVLDPAERVWLATLRTTLRLNLQQHDAAIDEAQSLAPLLRSAASQLDGASVLAALRPLAAALNFAGRSGEALSLIDAMAPHLDLTDAAQSADYHLIHGSTLCRALRIGAAVVELQAALREAARAGQVVTQIQAGTELLRACVMAGRPDEAMQIAEATIARIEDHRFGAAPQADCHSVLGTLLVAQSRADDGTAHLRRTRELFASIARPMPGVLLCNEALAATMCGRFDEAEVCLAEAQVADQPAAGAVARYVALVRARIARRRGEDPLPWLAEARAMGSADPGQGLLEAHAGAPHDATQLDAWRKAREQAGLQPSLRLALMLTARLALREGRIADALAAARGAVALAEAIDPWLDEGSDVWTAMAEVFDACEEPAAAADARAEAARWSPPTPPGPRRPPASNG